jgi:hypothetical protein
MEKIFSRREVETTRTFYVVQWAGYDIPRVWADYGSGVEYGTVDEVVVALHAARRRESMRAFSVVLRATRRVVVDEWMVGE